MDLYATMVKRVKLSAAGQVVVLFFLILISWALGWAESAFDGRLHHNRTFAMLDMGFEMTASLHQWLKANPRWHDGLAFANTAFVGLCYGYGIYFTYSRQRPALIIMAFTIYALRLLMGWATQLPVHPEYFSSALDFPDIIHGHNVNFFFFYSGHCAMPSLVARWATYPHGPLPNQWPIHILNLAQAIRMLATRGHYSIDMLVGCVFGLVASGYLDAIDDWALEYLPTEDVPIATSAAAAANLDNSRLAPRVKTNTHIN